LRNERDPVVRMAAGEAVFLSDREGESARLFLDAVVTDAASLARLRALAGEIDGATPVVGSLADLASEGNAEAVARLLEMAPWAAAEAGVAEPYAEALDEVARNAPGEVASALRAAPEAAADAALSALARGLEAPGGAEHPLAAALRKAAEEGDPARGEAARELWRKLGERAPGLRAAAPPEAPRPAAPVAQPGG
jgi:serine-type D-Ala-D-Ala carboxypeptidase/endopeptidase (penicillin-binding protein 4)